MLTLKVVVVAVILLMLFRRKSSAATGTIPNSPDDFDPVTAGQFNRIVSGDVAMGDDWHATFLTESGNWFDGYRSHASSSDDNNPEPGGIPL